MCLGLPEHGWTTGWQGKPLLRNTPEEPHLGAQPASYSKPANKSPELPSADKLLPMCCLVRTDDHAGQYEA